MQKERKDMKDGRIWRWLVNLWTFVLFFFILADFFNGGGFDNILGPVAAIYVAVLAIYSAEKEFERWQFYSVGRHPGEVYVFIWTALVVGMFVWTLVTRSSYKMSPEIYSTYIVVLGVLAITRKSKNLFKEKNKNN